MFLQVSIISLLPVQPFISSFNDYLIHNCTIHRSGGTMTENKKVKASALSQL
jgi:hypothetical protein